MRQQHQSLDLKGGGINVSRPLGLHQDRRKGEKRKRKITNTGFPSIVSPSILHSPLKVNPVVHEPPLICRSYALSGTAIAVRRHNTGLIINDVVIERFNEMKNIIRLSLLHRHTRCCHGEFRRRVLRRRGWRGRRRTSRASSSCSTANTRTQSTTTTSTSTAFRCCSSICAAVFVEWVGELTVVAR